MGETKSGHPRSDWEAQPCRHRHLMQDQPGLAAPPLATQQPRPPARRAGALAMVPGLSAFPTRRPWLGSASPRLGWAERGPPSGASAGGCSSLGTPGGSHSCVTSHLPYSGRGTPEGGRSGRTRHWGLEDSPGDDLSPVGLRKQCGIGRHASGTAGRCELRFEEKLPARRENVRS